MPIKIHVLGSSSELKPYVNKLKLILEQSIKAVSKVIETGNIDIIIYENPQATIKEIGIGGYTPVANVIFIALDSEHPKFRQNLDSELFYTLVHEINHAIRFRTPVEKESLLEAMISEGLADHFAMQISKEKNRQSGAIP